MMLAILLGERHFVGIHADPRQILVRGGISRLRPGNLGQVRLDSFCSSGRRSFVRHQRLVNPGRLGYTDLQLAREVTRRHVAVVLLEDLPRLGQQPLLGILLLGQLRVLGSTFLRQDYAMALPLGSPMRKPINSAILTFIQSDEWDTILRQYLSAE